MNINYKGRHIEITDPLRKKMEKKLQKLERFLKGIDNINVVFTSEKKDRNIVEVTLAARSIIIRAQEEQKDMYTAIDMVVDKLESQIKKYKGKLYDKFKNHYDAFQEVQEEEIEEENEEEISIDKVKEFEVKPMSPEEAVLQMELLGHNFFVFRNAENNKVNVVYKRKNGGYGLITTV